MRQYHDQPLNFVPHNLIVTRSNERDGVTHIIEDRNLMDLYSVAIKRGAKTFHNAT